MDDLESCGGGVWEAGRSVEMMGNWFGILVYLFRQRCFDGVTLREVERIDKLPNTRYAVDDDVHHIWAWGSEIHVARH